MAASKSGEAATLIRILLTMLLGLWTAVGPGFRVAAAAGAPPEHPATAKPPHHPFTPTFSGFSHFYPAGSGFWGSILRVILPDGAASCP